MDIKKKRRNVIKNTVLLGIALPIISAIFTTPKSDGGLIIVFCIVSAVVMRFTEPIIHNKTILFVLFIITHIMTYLLLGWIIARLVYPNKKALPESDNSSEPIQD